MKLDMWIGGNVLIMHVTFLLSHENVGATVTEIVKLLQRHMDPNVKQ